MGSDANVRLFDEHVPEEFQAAALRLLFTAYQESAAECSALVDSPQARDLLPQLRRAKIESALALLARRFPGMNARARKNAARNCHHIEVTAGTVVLTESKVDRPAALPAPAVFRDSLVRRCQLQLFEEDEPIGTTLYAIVTHGTDDGKRLAFARIGFPTADCLMFDGQIDLFARFGELATKQQPQVEIVADQDLALRLREKAKEDTL